MSHQVPGHTNQEEENSDGKSLKSSASRVVLVKSETQEALSTDPLTTILASLDHYYGIYGALSWDGWLQSS